MDHCWNTPSTGRAAETWSAEAFKHVQQHVGIFWHQLSFSLTLFFHCNPLQASVVVPNVTASSHTQSSAWLDVRQDLQMCQGSSNDLEFNNHYFKCSLILTNPVPWLTCKNWNICKMFSNTEVKLKPQQVRPEWQHRKVGCWDWPVTLGGRSNGAEGV